MSAPQVYTEEIFDGSIYFFYAFDVGDDIDFEQVRTAPGLSTSKANLSKYFKNYHRPLQINSSELPNECISVKVHSFGALSLTYRVPFSSTLAHVQARLDHLEDQYNEYALAHAQIVFKKIRGFITKPKFYHTRSSYVTIQVEPVPQIDAVTFKERYGGIIASSVRFEVETLSEFQKNEILDTAIGYYRGDLIVIDTDAAFVYDDEYQEILDFFEFANVQQLELQYFDRVLDQQLNSIYEGKTQGVPFRAYLPFVGTLLKGPVDELSKLKVDISVITERLESSIKIAGEPYFYELYSILVDKLDLKGWRDSIDKKLAIVKDASSVLQKKIDSVREDLLTTLIIILIFIEVLVGLLRL